MKNQYFNKYEFKTAMDNIEKNPLLAKYQFEEYFKNYPKDYSAYPYYISCLIVLGQFDEAKEGLNYLESLEKLDDKYQYLVKKSKFLNNNIIYCYIKLLCYEHKYNELLKLCNDNFSFIIEFELKPVIFYCRKKLGKLEDCSRRDGSYLYNQIVDYREYDFLTHIQKHLANFNKDLNDPNSSIFAYDFPIDKAIETIKNHIPSDKRLFYGFYDDTYIFKYDYCGKDNNKTTNYFKVVCLHDTNNIITMCPSANCENLPYIDLNYLNQNFNNENNKVKKLSQIDKFNQRYKL